MIGCSEYQRYQLLRAIHNCHTCIVIGRCVVPNIKDINFWEQFTTFFIISFRVYSCSEYQRYQLLRAIHNSISHNKLFIFVVPNIKDINFWEQFTTNIVRWFNDEMLFRISKISTFESNSQLKGEQGLPVQSCSEYQRYQLLRAIHNVNPTLTTSLLVVPNIKDINFWEQFTTEFGWG